MKRLLILGYYGFDNSGDDAILKAIVNDFKKLNNDLELIALSKNPEKTKREYGIDSYDRFNILKVIKALKHTDLFISGGGSLLQDITSTRSIIYYLFMIFLAKEMGKKVFVYANGIGPISKGFNRFLTKSILNKVDFITLRDYKSYDFVKKLGVKNKNIMVTTDPVFSLKEVEDYRVDEILKNENIKISNNTIGISIREWKRSENFEIKLSNVIDSLIEEGYDILVVPFHMPRDNEYSKKVINNSKYRNKISVLKGSYNAQELMGIFKRCKILLAMRLHSLIYGACVNKPMVGMIYDPKVKAMIKELGVEEFIDVENFTEEEFLKNIHLTLNNLDKRREIISINTEKQKMRAHENIEIALKLIDE